jgi:hypothetical protein
MYAKLKKYIQMYMYEKQKISIKNKNKQKFANVTFMPPY